VVFLGLHTTRLDIKQFYVLPLHSAFVCFTSQYKQGLYPYTALIDRFFGRSRKVAKSGYYLRHVRLSVCMEQLGSYGMALYEFRNLSFSLSLSLSLSLKYAKESRVTLKSDKYSGYFT